MLGQHAVQRVEIQLGAQCLLASHADLVHRQVGEQVDSLFADDGNGAGQARIKRRDGHQEQPAALMRSRISCFRRFQFRFGNSALRITRRDQPLQPLDAGAQHSLPQPRLVQCAFLPSVCRLEPAVAGRI
jgi:hypothetical protein